MHFACAACKGLSGRFLVKCTLGIYLYGRMEASSGGFMSIPGSDGAGAERRHVQLIISVLVGIGRPVIPAAAGCGFRPRVLSDRRPQPCLFPEPKRVSPAAQSPAPLRSGDWRGATAASCEGAAVLPWPPGIGRGIQPAMDRAHCRAAALSAMPGNRRRGSMAADNSPSCSYVARIAAASASVTTNMGRGWPRRSAGKTLLFLLRGFVARGGEVGAGHKSEIGHTDKIGVGGRWLP